MCAEADQPGAVCAGCAVRVWNSVSCEIVFVNWFDGF